MSLEIRAVINKTAAYLAAAGLEAPRLEAELLLGHVLDLDRTQLYVQFDRLVPEEALAALRVLLPARAKERIPLAYLVGGKRFLHLQLKIPRQVFIPRPETEELVDLAAKRLTAALGEAAAPSVLDLCTGSGAVALALAARFPRAQVLATDLSAEAAAAAAENARRLSLSDRVEVRVGDLWEAVPPARSYTLIIANPPYISQDALAGLPEEIIRHEPRLALDGGADGLAVYRRIFAGLTGRLAADGLLALEHGADQAEALAALALDAGLAQIECLPDLAGLPRFLFARAG